MFKHISLILITLIVSTLMGFSQSAINYSYERVLLEQSKFIENYEIRQNLRDVISSKQYNNIDISARVYTQEAYNNRVRVSVVRMDEFFYIIFANEIFQANHTSMPSAKQSTSTDSYDLLLSEQFETTGRGSYIIKKRVSDGTLEQIKVYLQSNSESYLLMTPVNQNEMTLDVYLFDTPIYRNVRLPINAMTTATIPLSRIMATVSHVVDWNLIFIALDQHTNSWNYLRQISRQIILRLPELHYVDDGMQNDKGIFVYGQTEESQSQKPFGLGNLGFIKWILDGFYAPLNQGRLMNISHLKGKSEHALPSDTLLSDSDTQSNPFLTLDWNRQMAYAVNGSIFSRRRIHLHESDITDIPFFTYTADVGYSIVNLKAILYLDSIRNPNSIYLGSINMLTSSNAPIARKHLESVLFIPYFDTSGNLEIMVFINNQTIPIDALIQAYKGSFIHLQKIATNNTTFTLPALVNP